METYYDILRVTESADDKEIKAAYRQAALAYHPDHIPKGVSQRMRDDAARTWVEIQEAFAVLNDHQKRREYDALLEEMRLSEELQNQFEASAPTPTPPKPTPEPPPVPPEPPPEPSPQPPQSTPPPRPKSSWLSFCYWSGRHWRKLCWGLTGILYIVNGARDPEMWSVSLISDAIFIVGIGFIGIVVLHNVPWKDRKRGMVNAATIVSFVVIGLIFTAGLSSPTSSPNTTATATQPTSPTNTASTVSSSTTATDIPQQADGTAQRPIANSGWLTQLPQEYVYFCNETNRSRCSNQTIHLKYLSEENVLLETGEFADYEMDINNKMKPTEQRWHLKCPLHQGENGHWIGACTYTLFWPEKGKPDIACKLATSEEITELRLDGKISGISGRINWAPRFNALNPKCPTDSEMKKEFQLVPKQ